MEASSNYTKTYSFCLVLIACIGSIYISYVQGVLNSVQFVLSADIFHWNESQTDFYVGLLGSMAAVGAAFGALSAGPITANYGRRTSIIMCDLISIAGLILSIFTILPIMIIGRGLCGIGVGLNAVLVALFIDENAPLELRGTYGATNGGFSNIGIFAAYVLGYGLPYPYETGAANSNFWRFMMFLFPAILLMLRIILLSAVFPFDTPKFLIQRDKDEEAVQVLKKIFRGSQARVIDHYNMLVEERDLLNSSNQLTFEDLFTRKYRYRTVIGSGVVVFSQASGCNVLFVYSTSIFLGDTSGSSGAPSESQYYEALNITVIVGIVLVIGGIVGAFMLLKIGRKTMYVGCIALTSTIWLIIAIFPTGLPVKLGFILFAFVYSVGIGSIDYLCMAEVLPDVGSALAASMAWISALVVLQGFPLLVEYTSLRTSFFVIFGINITAFILFSIYMKETKDKSYAEVIEQYTPDDIIQEEKRHALFEKERAKLLQKNQIC